MSVWYKVKSQKQLDNLVKKLEKCGFQNSGYGCPKEDCVAIALYEGEALYNSYTFLNEFMCGYDVYTSWILNRTEMNSEDEFMKHLECYQ